MSGTACIGILLIAALIVFVIVMTWIKRSWNPADRPAPPGSMDVSVVQIAIDWRARKELQDQLERLARGANTSSGEGLARLLRESAVALVRAQMSWLYAGAGDHACRLAPAEAERLFRQATSSAASRFQKEKIRNIAGAKSEAPIDATARPHEGEGVVVVTLAVAARREIPDVGDVRDAGRLRVVLEDFAATSASDLVAMEVIWSPAEDADRMSTAELVTLYPELKKIDPHSVAGRVFCKFCSGPYAAELLQCPHCGGNLQKDQVS